MLFGDELQAHVTAIQALNQIIHTAVSHKSGSNSSSKPSWRQKQNRPFFSQRPVPAQMEAKTVEEKGGAQQKINEDFASKLNSLQVTDFVGFVPTLIGYLVAQTSSFKSSRLRQFIPAWQQIS